MLRAIDVCAVLIARPNRVVTDHDAAALTKQQAYHFLTIRRNAQCPAHAHIIKRCCIGSENNRRQPVTGRDLLDFEFWIVVKQNLFLSRDMAQHINLTAEQRLNPGLRIRDGDNLDLVKVRVPLPNS